MKGCLVCQARDGAIKKKRSWKKRAADYCCENQVLLIRVKALTAENIKLMRRVAKLLQKVTKI